MTAPPVAYARELVPYGIDIGHIPYDLIDADIPTSVARRPELHDTYTDKGNGVPTTADTGQTWYQYPASGDQAMRVVSGKLTSLAASGGAAGYQQYDMGAPVTRIGADIVLGPYTTDTGAFAFAVWKSLMSGTVPDANLHLTINATAWVIGWWETGVGLHIVDGGTFTTPLVADSATVYRIDAVRHDTTWTVQLPDGSVLAATDAAFGATPGEIACFEVYQMDAATDTKSAALRVWADAQGPVVPDANTVLPLLAPLLAPGVRASVPVAKLYNPDANLAIPDPAAEVHANLRCTFVAGPTGGAIVEMSAYVQLGAATFAVLWTVFNPSGGQTASVWALSSNGTNYPLGIPIGVVQRYVFAPATFVSGATYTLGWKHWSVTANAGTVMAFSAGLGQAATMTVTPL
jgi:hypothetical protein